MRLGAVRAGPGAVAAGDVVGLFLTNGPRESDDRRRYRTHDAAAVDEAPPRHGSSSAAIRVARRGVVE